MATTPNKFARFWQELKRRKVLRSLAIYAGTAFIILEASSIIFPFGIFLNGASTWCFWLLILGAFINVIIAWIYDITPGGMQRTRPMEEVTPEERIPDSRGWKAATYISLVVIAALIIFNLVPIKTIEAGDIQSLLILPFDNFTGDENLDYVASGMHSALIGDMGQISALRVISKKTASVYKTKDMSLPEIAKEINMGAVIEPSVMCYGDSVCIQIRVITMYPEEKQLWVAEYKEEKSQILNLYSKITKEIANDLMVELTPQEEQILAKSRTVDREAYDAFLRSHQYWGDVSLESLDKAKEFLNSAIAKDPDWAPLYAGLAKVWLGLNQMGFVSPEIAGPEIYKNLNKALELDPENADSHYLTAMIAYLAEWNWEKSEKEFLKAIAINPNDAYSRIYYSHLLYILQRPEEAAVQARLAFELDPLNPVILVTYSAALLFEDDCETARIHSEKALEIDPGNFLANNSLGGVAFRCKDYKKAFEIEELNLQAYLSSTGHFDEDAFKEIERIFDEQGFFAAYEEILKQYEVLYEKGLINPGVMAINYITGNQQDKAMDCLERGFEVHDPQMPYIASGGYPFDSLYANPRFIAIREKMNLPSPSID